MENWAQMCEDDNEKSFSVESRKALGDLRNNLSPLR